MLKAELSAKSNWLLPVIAASLGIYFLVSPYLPFNLAFSPLSCTSEAVRDSSTALTRNIVEATINYEHIWDFKVSWTPDAGISTIDNDTVFSDVDCNQVIAIDTATGDTIWRYEVKRPNRIVVDSDREHIYIDALKGQHRLLLALDKDGNVVWANDTLPARGMTEQHMLPNGDIFAFALPLGFVSVDPVTGVFGDAMPYPNQTPTLPLVSGEQFWRLRDQQLKAWNIIDNTLVWESEYKQITEWPLKQILSVDGHVLLRIGGSLIALDEDTGRLQWQFTNHYIVSNIAILGEHVVFLDLDAKLHFLNKESGIATETISFAPPTEEMRDETNGIGQSVLTTSEDHIVVYFGDSNTVSAYKVNIEDGASS